MAISEVYTGSPTVGATEISMSTGTGTFVVNTADGVYQLFVDFGNLAAADEFVVIIYEKVTAGGVQEIVYYSTVFGVQSQPVFVAPSLVLMHGWEMTLRKIAGTDRVIPYSIRKVA